MASASDKSMNEINRTPDSSPRPPGKPEHMTHLNSHTLVPKTHPRIRLRGKLDSLQALILLTAKQALDENQLDIAAALEEFDAFAQELLRCEVTEVPLCAFTLPGLDSAGELRPMTSTELRRASHNPAGGKHPIPGSNMPPLALSLNYLRTQVREAEICAVEVERQDLIEALNRFSSAVYLLFLKCCHHA